MGVPSAKYIVAKHWTATHPSSFFLQILELPDIRDRNFHRLLHLSSIGIFPWSQEMLPHTLPNSQVPGVFLRMRQASLRVTPR